MRMKIITCLYSVTNIEFQAVLLIEKVVKLVFKSTEKSKSLSLTNKNRSLNKEWLKEKSIS